MSALAVGEEKAGRLLLFLGFVVWVEEVEYYVGGHQFVDVVAYFGGKGEEGGLDFVVGGER